MKIKVIAIIIAIMLIVSYVPVYADTTIPDPPSDVWEYWVIVEHPTSEFWLLCSHNPITVKIDTQHWIVLDGYKYYVYYGNNQWGMVLQKSGRADCGFSGVMYASNHDIAYEDGSGFFFLCPKVSTLSQGMKKVDFGTILRNFSTGLIPLLGLLILAISLAKGWGFLRTQLKH